MMGAATRIWTRTTVLGVLTALLFLAPAGVAVWSLRSNVREAARIERDTLAASDYARLRYGVRSEHAALRAEFGGETQFARAQRQVHRALTSARRHSEAGDSRRTVRLAHMQARLADLAERAFRAKPGGVPPHVLRRSTRVTRAMERQIARASAAKSRSLVADLRGHDRSQRRLVISAPLAFGALLILLSFLSTRVIRYRLRVEQSRQDELHRLQHAALTDNLTELRNRRACEEDLARELERRNRNGVPLSVMRLDLRGLKQINDTHGHQAGDARIRAVADVLRATLRLSDGAYRTGGDEFTVILPGERAWGAYEFAQRLRTRAAAHHPSVRVAMGITEAMGLDTVDTVTRRADLALIDAKRSRRGAVIYTEGLEPVQVARDGEGQQQQQQQLYKLLATSLARAVDAKDAGTRNHCETVAELCVQIGMQLGVPPAQLEQLRMAGLLHDVGKIGIADAILHKPAELDERESETMHAHVTIGQNIVAAAGLEEEAEWILHHHERVDGRGYPAGLSGDVIPLPSRIILVADAFEAVTADRPYRRGRPVDEALLELEANAGTQFDSACVAALRAVLAPSDAGTAEGADEAPRTVTAAIAPSEPPLMLAPVTAAEGVASGG